MSVLDILCFKLNFWELSTFVFLSDICLDEALIISPGIPNRKQHSERKS